MSAPRDSRHGESEQKVPSARDSSWSPYMGYIFKYTIDNYIMFIGIYHKSTKFTIKKFHGLSKNKIKHMSFSN